MSAAKTPKAALWYAFDMDAGVIAAARTRREVMRLAEVPTSREPGYRWERHRYGPDSEEIVFGYRDEDADESVFVTHGADAAVRHGWEEALEKWQKAGAPVGVRIDETAADGM